MSRSCPITRKRVLSRRTPAVLAAPHYRRRRLRAARGPAPCHPPRGFGIVSNIRRLRSGLTLAELLIGIALFIGSSCALLWAMTSTLVSSEYLGRFQVALHAAQGELEGLSSTSFEELTGPAFADARRLFPPGPSGQLVCVGEDTNCNGILDGIETDANGNGKADAVRLGIQIRQSPEDALIHPATQPAVLELHAAACGQVRGRMIGEDQNCNGALDPGEDANGNGWIDSPAMVSTRVAR